MADFDAAEVEVKSTRPLPNGHRFPSLDFTLTMEPQRVSAERASEIKDALPHTIVTEDDVRFTPIKTDATAAAEELAAEHDIQLSRVEGSGKDGRVLKSDVQALV